MPTRIDAAAEAAHEEIANAVGQIENNLSQPSANNNQLPSPLFRDEVQQQEMRYLDGLLSGKKVQKSQSEVAAAAAADAHQYKECIHQPNRSKIASILSPYDRKDDDENQQSTSSGQASSHSVKQNEPQKIHNKQMNQNNNGFKSKRSNGTPISESGSIGHKLHTKISGLIRHNNKQPAKPNNSKRHTHNQKRARTAAPSRNKRCQMNHKLIKRAQLSSRRVISKMVRLGRRCTQNLTTIKNAINKSVARAMANAHSMLEETSVRNGKSVRNTLDLSMKINVNDNKKVGSVNHAGQARTGAKEGGTAATAASSSQNHSSITVPPKKAFSLAPSWMLGGTERMSSKAVSMVQKTIRSKNVMKR